MKPFRRLPALLLAAWLPPAPAAVPLYAIDAPPLVLLDPTRSRGEVGDIVLEALARAGYPAELRNEPWARAQKRVSGGEDLLIMPLTRTRNREASFTWIAPITRMERAFFSLQHRVDSFDEAKATFRQIGVGQGSAQYEALITRGFTEDQIVEITIGDNPARMLELGRIDAWFNGVEESRYIWREQARPPLLMGQPLLTEDIYLACSRQCDPQMVMQLRQALDAMRQDGSFDRLQGAYRIEDDQPPTGG